ncbi:unnamed protein product [Brassica oleracea]
MIEANSLWSPCRFKAQVFLPVALLGCIYESSNQHSPII